MSVIFTIGDQKIWCSDSYFEKRYSESGVGIGDLPLKQLKAFIDSENQSLTGHPCDIRTEWENDLSRAGHALYKANKKGIESVHVQMGG